MKYVQLMWNGFQKVGLFVGEIVSSIILVVFYFSFFGIFALPARLFGKFLEAKSSSQWIIRAHSPGAKKDFQYE